MPEYFADPFEELRQIRDYELFNQQVSAATDTLTAADAQMIGALGRVLPYSSPGLLYSLGRAGIAPNDPVVEYAATIDALATAHETGFASQEILGRTVNPHQLEPGHPANRWRNLTDAAIAVGLVDDDGILSEPEEGSSWEKRRLYERIREFAAAENISLGFRDKDGRGRIETSEIADEEGEPISDEDQAEIERLTEAGFVPLNWIIEEHPELEQPVLDAIEAGFIDDEGVAWQPAKYPFLDMTHPEYKEAARQFGELRTAFADAGVDLPFMASWETEDEDRHLAFRPTVVRYSQQRKAAPHDQVGDLIETEFAGYQFGGVHAARARDVSEGLGRTVLNVADAALWAPYEEATGLFRASVAAAGDRGWVPPTELAKGLGQSRLAIGLGMGRDPASEQVRVEQLRRQTAFGKIQGEDIITIGRAYADAFGLDVGTKPYQAVSGAVDFSVAIGADPAAWALGGARKLGQARRTFQPESVAHAVGYRELRPTDVVGTTAREKAFGAEAAARLSDAGALRGTTRWVDGPTWTQWTQGRTGHRVMETIAAEKSPGRIWEATQGKLPAEFYPALANADEAGQVARILEPLVTKQLRTTDFWKAPVGGPMSFVGDYVPASLRTRRSMQQVPGRSADLADPSDFAHKLNDWMHNARFDPDIRRFYLDRALGATTRAQRFDILADVMDGTRGILANLDVAPQVRSRHTKLFRESHEAASLYFVDATGQQVPWRQRVSSALVGGETKPLGSPHLPTELINRFVPLPDYRPISRLTSSKSNLLTKAHIWTPEGDLGLPAALVHGVFNNFWKRTALFRMAWPVRVIGEEQARMAGADLDSMFRHPMSYIAWTTGKKGDIDVMGRALVEAQEHRMAMTRSIGMFVEEARPGVIPTHHKTVYRKTDHELDLFTDAWAREITLLHNDPLARYVARADNLDDAVEWFARGEGSHWRREMASVAKELNDPAAARRYVETVSERIKVKTGGNTELLDAIRTGRLRGREMLQNDSLTLDRHMTKTLRGMLDDAPDAVVGREVVQNVAGMRGTISNQWDGVTDWVFGHLMTKPSDYLSRSPVFRQKYWQQIRNLAPYADDVEALARYMPNKRWARGVRGGAYGKRVAPEKRLTTDEIDELAKGYALDETKDLLYDLGKRSQVMDAMRLVWPFGEAWREVMTRWADLAAVSVRVPGTASARIPVAPARPVRRLQQILDGGGSPDLGEFLGAPDGEGFFHVNQFGDLAFIYPFSSFVSGTLSAIPGVGVEGGLPIPLSGTVQGMNMVGGIVPGVGPAVQIPAAYIQRWVPEPEWMWDQIMPFGPAYDPDQPLAGLGSALTYMPPWVRYGLEALFGRELDSERNRMMGNSIGEVSRYLHSRGSHPIDTPGDIAELQEDATRGARWLYAIRALGSFVLPSAPRPEYVMEANDQLIFTHVLAEEYRRLRDENFEDADRIFLDKYGPNVVLAMVNFTETTVPGGLPTSEEFGRWARDNSDLRKNYPHVYAYAGPDTDGFDYNVYKGQFATGERVSIPLGQDKAFGEWVRFGNAVLAQVQYDQARKRIGDNPTPEQRDWLSDVREQLEEEYPGFNHYSDFSMHQGRLRRPDDEVLFRELGDLARDPKVSGTDFGRATREFLSLRDKAIEEARRRGVRHFKSAKAAEDLRVWLREHAEVLARRNPQFRRLFERLLMRELRLESDDDEEE